MSYELCCLPDDKCKDTASETRCQVFGDIFSEKDGRMVVYPERFGALHKTWICFHPNVSMLVAELVGWSFGRLVSSFFECLCLLVL